MEFVHMVATVIIMDSPLMRRNQPRYEFPTSDIAKKDVTRLWPIGSFVQIEIKKVNPAT